MYFRNRNNGLDSLKVDLLSKMLNKLYIGFSLLYSFPPVGSNRLVNIWHWELAVNSIINYTLKTLTDVNETSIIQ